MRNFTIYLAVAVAACGASAAQSTAGSTAAGQKQGNAASAKQDTSATTGDQITKPAGATGTALIGCLEGPDQQGRYTLRSMQHRSGVEVLGPSDLKNDSGAKVKLTGKWMPAEQKSAAVEDKNTAGMQRFQVTHVEVMGQHCKAPVETSPGSKQKRGPATTYEAPNGEK